MQSYKYNELSGRGKSYVMQRYSEEQAVQEQADELIEQGIEPEKIEDAGLVFDALGWRFTEHGERVA